MGRREGCEGEDWLEGGRARGGGRNLRDPLPPFPRFPQSHVTNDRERARTSARGRLLYPRYRSDIIVRSKRARVGRCRGARVLQRARATKTDVASTTMTYTLGPVFNNLLLLLSIVVASATTTECPLNETYGCRARHVRRTFATIRHRLFIPKLKTVPRKGEGARGNIENLSGEVLEPSNCRLY